MLDIHQRKILEKTGSKTIERIERIQELWSGYGVILRVHLSGGEFNSVVVKNIAQPSSLNHPRGWNTEISNARKIKSYEVETNWYRFFSEKSNCRIPRFIDFWESEGQRYILLEDLNDVGFPLRKSNLTLDEIDGCLRWLANFHGTFLNVEPKGLWEVGTYWHLGTRPDEYEKMGMSDLKVAAQKLDRELNNCQYMTLVHGDAKVANFCFGNEADQVAAVDFQYVGAGCGMKDLAYFLGSVLEEDELELLEDVLLSKYFQFLSESVSSAITRFDFYQLEQEWRRMYPIAWADFTRFLLGWMPTHRKLNRYSEKMVEMALELI
ncbi:MAG: oxidoreductase family protein [Crocinitomicaceae bacterium]